MLFLLLWTVHALNATDYMERWCVEYKNTTVCQAFDVCPYMQNCTALPFVAAVCQNQVTPTCNDVNQICNDNTSCNPTFFSSIPSDVDLMHSVDNICQDMPNMKACGSCPAPTQSTGIFGSVSACPFLTIYSQLCLEMPKMEQCQEYVTLCASDFKTTPFCNPNAVKIAVINSADLSRVSLSTLFACLVSMMFL